MNLLDRLKKAEEVIEYYASKNTWKAFSTFDQETRACIEKEDMSMVCEKDHIVSGGKKAREYFEQPKNGSSEGVR